MSKRSVINGYASRLPLATTVLHAVLFAVTVIYIYTSSDGQAALVWTMWLVPDFPVSLLHLLAPAYSRWIHSVVVRDSVVDYFVYAPHVIHGLFGTLWWYLMPRAVLTQLAQRSARSRRETQTHHDNIA
jgi:uncharacterized membrane protein YjdF